MASHTVGVRRPSSRRSVASNSSVASGKSIIRRSRTRVHSGTVAGTVTGTPPRAETPNDLVPELPYVGTSSEQSLSLAPPEKSTTPFSRPQHSPIRTTVDIVIQDEALVVQQRVEPAGPPHTVGQRRPSPSFVKSSQTSGLPVLPTALQPEPPPSAFSRDPSLVNISGNNVRDSLSTQLSGMSSSIYPPSTPSVPDSLLPSPPSMVAQDDSHGIPYEVGEVHSCDSDDVSYRLHLLMKNSYFLPPAHSKPSPADLASSSPVANAQKKSSRSITPTFLDLLWGKSKWKHSPVSPDAPPSALRTAADSVGPVLTLKPRLSSQMPRVPPLSGVRTGRVVVVREKMDDLSAAARQAETDMKLRETRRDQPSACTPSVTDIVDPTDAVDIPIPSPGYPFAVQASAMHGLGVSESVGAAVLADRLPPPHSPGMSISSDDDWRKALLHQAVHHSLDGLSQDISTFHIRSTSTPLMSPRHGSVAQDSLSLSPVANIGKHILDRRIINSSGLPASSSPLVNNRTSNYSLSSTTSLKVQKDENPGSFRQSFLPSRAETPSNPLTPLTPAPRKFLINPLHSLSQAELETDRLQIFQTPTQTSQPSHSLRKTVSSPVLSEEFGCERTALTPPLPTPKASSFQNLADPPAFDAMSQMTRDSRFSDDLTYEGGQTRASLALSAINGRPSCSEYPQLSPSPSSYDILNNSNASNYQRHRQCTDQGPPCDNHAPRYCAMFPPPRVSSSLDLVALSPPPRTSSLRYLEITRQSSGNAHVTEPLTDDTTKVIVAPKPTSPARPTFLPLAERRGNPAPPQLSLNIPQRNIPVDLHSAPGPSSPTSFFDTIQSQHAMDDLDSSDSEDDNDETYRPSQGLMHPYADPHNRNGRLNSNRPSITRLGNHSTPHFNQIAETAQGLFPSLKLDSKRPSGKPLSTKQAGRGDSGHDPPDLARRHRPATADQAWKRRSTVTSVADWRGNQSAKESMKKLDSMLIRHIEAEKDKMRQIARTIRAKTSDIPADTDFF